MVVGDGVNGVVGMGDGIGVSAGEEVVVDLEGSNVVGGVGGIIGEGEIDAGELWFDTGVEEDECVTLLGVTSSGSLATFTCFFFFSAANMPKISRPSSSPSEPKSSDLWSLISTM